MSFRNFDPEHGDTYHSINIDGPAPLHEMPFSEGISVIHIHQLLAQEPKPSSKSQLLPYFLGHMEWAGDPPSPALTTSSTSYLHVDNGENEDGYSSAIEAQAHECRRKRAAKKEDPAPTSSSPPDLIHDSPFALAAEQNNRRHPDLLCTNPITDYLS
jgi:hypothetical protein